MSINWNTEIIRFIFWRQLAAAHDKDDFPWYVPRGRAAAEQISAAETATGAKFSDEFAEFLRHANGWKYFIGTTDLFGIDDFLSGRAKTVSERPALRVFLRREGIDASRSIPIGASSTQSTVFLHFCPNSKFLPGGVLWFGTERQEIGRFPSFSSFFDTMVFDEEETALEWAKENGWSETEAKSQAELMFQQFVSTGQRAKVMPKMTWEALAKSRK